MARSTPKNVKAVNPIPKAARAPLAIVIATLCLLSLVFLISYAPQLGILPKLALGVASLLVTGLLIARVLGVLGTGGLYILKTSRGLGLIDRISKRYATFWKVMVDWGLVLSFGVLTYFFFRKHVSKKMIVLGVASILLMQLFVLPYLTLAISLISTPQFTIQPSSSYVPSSIVAEVLQYGFVAISLIGGFSLYIISELVYVAAIIVHGIAAFIIAALSPHVSIPQAASNLPPPAGIPVAVVPFLEPSIAIPLLLSLALLVTLHEISHGVIARQYGIRLRSIGTFIFGIIPGGAFVEPDEKSINKLPREQQDKISIAGVSFNYLLTIVFFALMLLMYYFVLPNLTSTRVYIESTIPGSPAYNAIPVGSIILSWNNHTIHNLSDLATAGALDKPYAPVDIATPNKTYSITADSSGKIGVYLGDETVPLTNSVIASAADFLYIFFGLSFLLNFYVAIFNILPLPLFDGWRIYKLRISEKKLRLITFIALTVFVLLFVPWIWSL